jgi:hypothetical protein
MKFVSPSQEIARNELSSLSEQYNNLENEIRELESKSAYLAELYTEQEELLSRVSVGRIPRISFFGRILMSKQGANFATLNLSFNIFPKNTIF